MKEEEEENISQDSRTNSCFMNVSTASSRLSESCEGRRGNHSDIIIKKNSGGGGGSRRIEEEIETLNSERK